MTQLITDGIDTAVVKLMELDDLTGPVATEFCDLLNQMADEFRNQGTDRAADALVDCVEKINPESDYSQAVKQISKTLSCLQDLTIHGKAIDEITFPNEGSETGETVCEHVDAPAPDSEELPDLSDVVDQLNADETSEETNESNDSSSIDKIDLAVMKLMEVDSFDSPEANELTELLNDLSDVFQQSDAMRATVALNMCIGGIAANENFQKVIQQISKTLSCLQDYKIHGKSLDEITFPNEELSTSESDSVAEVSADLEEMEQLAAQLTEADDTPVAASNDNTVGVNGKSEPVLFRRRSGTFEAVHSGRYRAPGKCRSRFAGSRKRSNEFRISRFSIPQFPFGQRFCRICEFDADRKKSHMRWKRCSILPAMEN